MSLTLPQLVAQARLDDVCQHGHDWQTDSARGCQRHEDEGLETCQGSQSCYVCARCGEIDYGERGGPGYADCVTYCGRDTTSRREGK